MEIFEKDPLKWNPHVMRLDDKNSEVNSLLNAIGQKFHFFLILNASRLPEFNTVSIREYILGKKLPEAITVLAYIDKYYQTIIKEMTQFEPKK